MLQNVKHLRAGFLFLFVWMCLLCLLYVLNSANLRPGFIYWWIKTREREREKISKDMKMTKKTKFSWPNLYEHSLQSQHVHMPARAHTHSHCPSYYLVTKRAGSASQRRELTIVKCSLLMLELSSTERLQQDADTIQQRVAYFLLQNEWVIPQEVTVYFKYSKVQESCWNLWADYSLLHAAATIQFHFFQLFRLFFWGLSLDQFTSIYLNWCTNNFNRGCYSNQHRHCAFFFYICVIREDRFTR